MKYNKLNYFFTISLFFSLIIFSAIADEVVERKIISRFDYHDVSKTANDNNYTWQCPYVISDEKYTVKVNTESPLVDLFEVDEKRLYIELDHRLIKLDFSNGNGNTHYFYNKKENIRVDVEIIKKYNFSDYDESHDRNVKLVINHANKTELFYAVGQSCGI